MQLLKKSFLARILGNNLQAIILAGGLGTRLASVLEGKPKPMAQIKGRPFLELLLDFLSKEGITKAILALSYKHELIQDYFKKSYKNISLSYSIENSPLGTGGALKQALSQCDKEEIFVCNGDSFFNLDFKKLLAFKREFKNSKICLGLKKMQDFDRYGRVELDEKGFIRAFREKEFCKEGLINAGIYLVDKDLFENFESKEKFSFELFLQDHFLALRARGAIFDGYFIDIGVPQDYEEAKRSLIF